jgi:hypothetical protein
LTSARLDRTIRRETCLASSISFHQPERKRPMIEAIIQKVISVASSNLDSVINLIR